MKMTEELKTIFYYNVLEGIEKLVPKFVFDENRIARNDTSFKVYLQTLKLYTRILTSLDQQTDSLYRKFEEKRLRKIFELANQTTWWQQYFRKHNINPSLLRSLADLALIPPISRFDLVDLPKKDLLLFSENDPHLVWRSSGGSTTGTPFQWALNKNLLTFHVMARFVTAFEEHSLSFDTFATKGAYTEINYPHGSHRSEFKWFSIGDYFAWSDEKESGSKLNHLVSILQKNEPLIVRIIPSELHWLTGEFKEKNLSIPVALFSVTGQQLQPGVRKLAEDYFKCPVLVHYGAQEMGPLSLECKDVHGYYHIFRERVIVEILDTEGRSVPPGSEGNLTITVLDNTAMPLIRYQPGDLAALHTDISCSCRNRSPLLEIRSRSTDVFKFDNGEILPARNVLRIFGSEPLVSLVKRFQVRQEQFNSCAILIQPRDSISENVISILRNKLHAFYGGKLKVTIKVVHHLQQDGRKFKVFVPLK